MSSKKQKQRKGAMPTELTKGAPWTPGPWRTGPTPHGHCRIYADSEVHAVARTYGEELNSIGICELTGPRNAADAVVISLAPEMLEVVLHIAFSDEIRATGKDDHSADWHLLVARTRANDIFDFLASNPVTNGSKQGGAT